MPVSTEIRVRLRTTQRADERGQAVECFVLLELLTVSGGAKRAKSLALTIGQFERGGLLVFVSDTNLLDLLHRIRESDRALLDRSALRAAHASS